MTSLVQDPQQLLKDMFNAAIEAVSPQNTIPQALATLDKPKGRTLLLCVGKAAAQMGQIAEDILLNTLGADHFSGIVVTKVGNELPMKHLQVMTAPHPKSDARSMVAAQRLLAEAGKLTPNDRLLVLMSGGASALTLLPADNLSLEDATAVNDELLRGGVPIDDMNTLRRHISSFNGGRLARAAGGADIVTFAVSDVPGDKPEIIGSGATAPDPTTFKDARDVVTKYNLTMPANVTRHLVAAQDESVKPNANFWRHKYRFEVVASNRHAVNAAAEHARKQGVRAIIIDEPIVGDAAEEAKRFAEIVRTRTYNGETITGPAVFLRGGEAVVKLPKDFEGRGGRVGHAALSYLSANPDSHAFFGGTDGSDGTSGHAAISLTPSTAIAAKTAGLDATMHLREYKSADFFDHPAIKASLPERPTGTNVNEIYMAYVA